MKPGSKDIKYFIKIEGTELDELQKLTWMMAESFGLDTRIGNYAGKRPIGLYRWDIECLTIVIECALNDPDECPQKNSPEYQALCELYEKLKALEKKASEDY